MYQTKNKPVPPNAAERNEKVRAVLAAATGPLSPSEIASKINEPWCCWGPRAGMSAPISPVCKRIGAVVVKRGQWVLPGSKAAASAERAK